MRLSFISVVLFLLAACAETSQSSLVSETSLPFFGDGYRMDGDPCRRLGESPETVELLDHTAELVGCPQDMQDLDAFERDTGADEVLRQDGYVVYSIPIGI